MTRRIMVALLRLAPTDFREKHERDVLITYDRRLDDADSHVSRAWYSVREVVGTAVVVIRLLLSATGENGRRRRGSPLASLVSDVRFAFRTLVKNWAVTLVAVLSLGLGIAVVISMLIASDTLLVRPLPYDREGDLAFLGTRTGSQGSAASPSSVQDFLGLRAQMQTAEVAAYRQLAGVNLGGDPPEWTSARRVSANFFEVLGVSPRLGGLVRPEDEGPGAAEVVALSSSVWERRFGSDPSVIGTSVSIDGVSATVVGVLPEGFEFGFESPDLWLPLRMSQAEPRSERTVNLVARVAYADFVTASEELGSLAQAYAESSPGSNSERSFVLSPIRDEWFGDPSFQQGLAAANIATLIVLLIACANVANLMLARGSDRAGEIAVRTALGASRGRVLRQLLVEAVVLASIGGMVALAGSIFGLSALRDLATGFPIIEGIEFDLRGGILATVVVLLTALLFGLLPALRTLRGGNASHLTRRTASGGSHSGRMRGAIVAAEIGLAVVLLATTGVIVRSVAEIRAVDTGFEPRGVLTFALDLPETNYRDPASVAAILRRLEEELGALPGAAFVGISMGLPGQNWTSLPFELPERPPAASDEVRYVPARIVTSDWFAAVGARVPERGREIASGDDSGASDVVLVNESFVRANWPDLDPLGRTIGLMDRRVQVVGTVPDLMELGPAFGSRPIVYLPLAQWPYRSIDVVVRPHSLGSVSLDSAREVVRRMDPNLAVHSESTLEAVLELSAQQYLAMGKLLTTLSIITLCLALAGVYSSVSYAVSRRVPEIGIRMALGADRRSVRAMILWRATVVSGLGLLVGLASASAATRGVSTLLFNVTPFDVSALLGSAAVILLVSLAAAWVPATRASALNPMQILRED